MKYITVQLSDRRWFVARKLAGGVGYKVISECKDEHGAKDIADALENYTPPVEKVEPIADYKPRRRAA